MHAVSVVRAPGSDAKFRDLILAVRADEANHREVGGQGGRQAPMNEHVDQQAVLTEMSMTCSLIGWCTMDVMMMLSR